MGISLQCSQKLPQNVGTENQSTWLMRKICKKDCSQPTDRFGSFCWNDSACISFLLFMLSLPNCFFGICLPALFAAVLNFFVPLTTSAISGVTKSNKSALTRFAAGTLYLRKKNCNSHKYLGKCTKSASTFWTTSSTEWNLYLSWSNYLVTYFGLEMIVGGFSKYQNKTSDTDRRNGFYLSARASQVKVNTMKRFFEQWSELQVAECQIVHVLSSSYNASTFELWHKRKATQQWGFRVANDIALNQVRIYQERAYADNGGSKFWLVRPVSSQTHSNFITNIATEKMFQVQLKNGRPDPSFPSNSQLFPFFETL